MPVKRSSNAHNVFKRLHAIHKNIICLIIAVGVYLVVGFKNIHFITHIMVGWDAFSLSMIVMSWITFKITTSTEIRNQAGLQDSSRAAIFIITLIATFAGFLAVLLLLITKSKSTESVDIPVAIMGMLFSWFLVHTIFAMRYAHIYYGDHDTKPDTPAGGLDFPDDKKPDYYDFAYFSFVLGMTFQVSDVTITAKRLRKLALLHGIISFGFNTIIVALTINVIAGLTK